MRRTSSILLPLLLFLGLAGPGWAQTPPPEQKEVWHWFAQCPSPSQMTFRVLYQGRSIYETTFPVCAMKRSEIPVEEQQKRLKFSLRADVKIFHPDWGQRRGVVDLEGNIWEAGGEANGLILGVSFATPGPQGQIWLNSMHIAEVSKRNRWAQADQLFTESSFKQN